jgi:hypothetical protein
MAAYFALLQISYRIYQTIGLVPSVLLVTSPSTRSVVYQSITWLNVKAIQSIHYFITKSPLSTPFLTPDSCEKEKIKDWEIYEEKSKK